MTNRKTPASKRKSESNPRKNVQFELSAAPGSRVSVAGTFNNWDPEATPLKENPESGYFTARLTLPGGEHEYKFVVDGTWTEDPKCSEQVPDGCGAQNSVLHV